MPSNPRSFITRILLVMAAVLAHGTMSWACSCLPSKPCGLQRYGDADFVGEVLSRQFPSLASVFFPDARFFRVRVVESFRESQKAGDIVTVKTGFGGGDCGYEFKKGAKYLIDASQALGVFSTSICRLTAPLEKSGVELRALRKIAARQRVPDLTGIVVSTTETDDSFNTAPLPLVPVELKRSGGRVVSRAVTDSAGAFTFLDVPKGSYDIQLKLPSNLSIDYTDLGGDRAEDQPVPISIEKKDGETTACHLVIYLGPSGNISGRVQSADGGPIEGWVNADTVTRDDKPWNTVRTVTPTPDGAFVLDHLKPGRYSVQFTSRAGFKMGPLQIIQLKDGERRKDIILKTR